MSSLTTKRKTIHLITKKHHWKSSALAPPLPPDSYIDSLPSRYYTDIPPPPYTPIIVSNPTFFKTKQDLDAWNDRENQVKSIFLGRDDIMKGVFENNCIICSRCSRYPSTRACTSCGMPYCSYYCLRKHWLVGHYESCSVVEYYINDGDADSGIPKRNTVWYNAWGDVLFSNLKPLQ